MLTPEGQRLGGEHGLHQALGEELFDDFLEGGQHAGVVGRDAPQQPVAPVPEAQHLKVVGGDVLARLHRRAGR